MSLVKYNDMVLEHFEHPRNTWVDDQGPSPCAQLASGQSENDRINGQGGSISAGVWMAFELEIGRQVITKARFRTYGCPHSIALGSWLTERLVGERLDSGYTLDRQEIVSVLHLPTEKMRSVLVAEDALRACAHKLESKEAC